MIRISGVIMPLNKHLVIALRGIFGIGRSRALHICNTIGIKSDTKVSELNEIIINKIQNAVKKFEVEGDLRRRVAMNIKRLRDIRCYRGLRHRMGFMKK